MKPKIILNADDFGAMEGIDQGIIKGIKAGVVNSVSTFTNFPDSKERILNLINNEEITNKFSVGLHLSVTSGYGDNPDLYPSLMQKNSNKFATIRGIKLRTIRKNQLKVCLWEQVNKLRDCLGGYEKIDHINMHHNICTLYLDFFPILIEILTELKDLGFDIPLRSPMTWTKSGSIYFVYKNRGKRRPLLPIRSKALENIRYLKYWRNGRLRDLFALFQGALLENVYEQQNILKENKIRHSYSFIDQYFGQPNSKNIEAIYKYHPDGETVEFMLHLFDSDYPRERKNGIDFSYLKTRQTELNTLIEHFNSNHYDLVNHKDLKLT